MAMGEQERHVFCILDVDYVLEGYDFDEPVIRIWGRTKNNRSICVLDRSFRPYFYVELKDGLLSEEMQKVRDRIMETEVEGSLPLKIEEVERRLLGRKLDLLKITVKKPVDVPKFREEVKQIENVKEQYEYGISFYRRYMIDRGLVPMRWAAVSGERTADSSINCDIIMNATDIKPEDTDDYPKLRVLAFDTETVQDTEENIIMISLCDNRGFKKAITYGKERVHGVDVVFDEKSMIEKFVKYVQSRDPDIIVGYNTDRFDFAKIVERANKHKIDIKLGRTPEHLVFQRRKQISSARIAGRVHIDIFDFVEQIMEATLSTEVLTLDRVAQELIGKGKTPMTWRDVEIAWKNRELRKIADYCLRDSELALNLAETVMPQIFELCRVTGQEPFDVTRMSYSQLVEWLLIRRGYEIGELAPNRPKYDEVQKRRRAAPYVGGYVHIPKQGIHEKIALFDFASLYPSIVMTHNVSPETLDCACCGEDGEKNPNYVPDGQHFFCSKHRGFVTGIIEDLVKKRKEIKKRVQAFAPRSRNYKMLDSRQHAMKILANASYGYYGYPGSRWYSRICAESITAWGRMYIKKIIALAESLRFNVIYGDTDSLFLKMKSKKEASEFLKRANDALPGAMELDFRDMYKRGIFVLAKTGIAAKKRYALIDYNNRILIRGFEKVRRDWAQIAKDTQEKVITYVLKDRSPEKAAAFVRGTIEKLSNKRVDLNDLVIYTQLTKPISEYEQIGPHVAAAKKLIESGREIKEGYTVSYIIAPGTGSISSRAVPSEFASDYDREYYIYHQVVPAALRVLGILDYKEDDLVSRAKQSDLRGFAKKR